jgi:hypothetical protein
VRKGKEAELGRRKTQIGEKEKTEMQNIPKVEPGEDSRFSPALSCAEVGSEEEEQKRHCSHCEGLVD